MTDQAYSLAQLGWSQFFLQQVDLDEWESTAPARIFGLSHDWAELVGEGSRDWTNLPGSWLKLPPRERPTVGDWVLRDRETGLITRLLDRTSLISRQASGRESREQLLAANVDTLFIVSSCNQEFSLSRLERYLALAFQSQVEPVIVLTKIDLIEQADDFRRQAEELSPGLAVVMVNSKDPDLTEPLFDWLGRGRTVALVGSSGVGKSTLINTLTGRGKRQTGEIRDKDDRGRHTTTARSLHVLPQGGLLLDSPGLRELQLSAAEDGLAALFEEIEAAAVGCRFADCRHDGEPGCAVVEAVEQGLIDPRRLNNYRKLAAEQIRTAETEAQKRRKGRRFGRLVRSAMADRKNRRGGIE